MSVTELHPVTLGCSQLADAIGVGYSSPIRVYGELLGLPGFERPDTEAMRLGRRLQPVIFAEACERGYDVVEYRAFRDDAGVWHDRPELRDPARKWLVGHPDGQSTDGALVVDAKARSWLYDESSTEVQLLGYMHLGGYTGGLYAQLHNLALSVHEVERDERRIELILHLAERFMGYVHAREWPPPTGHPDDVPAQRAAFPGEPGKRVRETKGVREARRELRALNEADGKHGARSARKNWLQGVIQAHMGDATELLDHATNDVRARWTAGTSRRFDSKRHEAECPECHAKYTNVTATRRLTLT